MNQRLITVREKDNRSLEAVERMRQERTAEVAALRAEVARLKEIERLLLEEVQYYKGRADSTYETMLAISRGLR